MKRRSFLQMIGAVVTVPFVPKKAVPNSPEVQEILMRQGRPGDETPCKIAYEQVTKSDNPTEPEFGTFEGVRWIS